MGYLILGVVVIALIFWVLIDCIQDLGARASRLERENMSLKDCISVLEERMYMLDDRITALEFKEDNQ